MKTALSEKQEKVLKLYLAGYTPTEIAEIMGLHINTVCTYRSIVMEKWEVENLIELIVESIRRGYLELEKDEEIPHIEFTYSDKRLKEVNYVDDTSADKTYTYTYLVEK